MTDRVGQHVGNYQLVRLVGRGGQAEVYLGEHRYLKSFAALKVLHASLDDTHAQQFLTEAQILARLVHPSIVRVLDFTVEQGTPVLIMDYSPAGTMRNCYPLGTCLPLATVVSAVSQVASALQYAHDHHVIHRDVKPENLLLGPRDEVLLTDFGLSVFAPSPELLSTQAMSGTLPYMAPEQLQGHPVFASDQYSLAIVAYEWLTGKRPFTGMQWQLIQQQLYAAPPPLRELNPSVPAGVEAVILRALAKDPRERYVSVQGFAQALAQASQKALQTARDAEVTAPHRLAQAEPQDELGAPPDQSAQPPPSPAPKEFAQDTERPLQTRVLSSQQQRQTEQTPPPSTDVKRRRLLEKVRAFWVAGVLEHSLHGAALIALGLREQPDAVANPWHLVMESPGEPAQTLPPGTSVVQAYDEAVGELLILGEPGSGKTTLLLELARTLLDRAAADETHPMPVVFNLSSWATKRQPLTQWLIEELNTRYQVPRKLGTEWVESDAILPLLDGLDEVAPEARTRCVEAINLYRLTHGLVPTVVCSRSTEYFAQIVPILLRRAVMVQPLTEQQIDAYLSSTEGQLEFVRAILHTDPVLQELATTPLMLSVLTLTYHGMSTENLLATDLPATRQQVLAAYVQRMFQRRGTESRYTIQQTTNWLVWLAKQLTEHNQTVFYIERMQPVWLPEGRPRRFYQSIAVGLLGGLLGGLMGGLVYGLLNVLVNVLIGVLIGVLTGGLISARKTEIKPAEVVGRSWTGMWRSFVTIEYLSNGLLGGLVGGLLGGLILALIRGLAGGLVGALLGALVGVLTGVLTGGLISARKTEIKPAEVVGWSWAGMWRGFVMAGHLSNGLLYVLIVGLGVGLVIRLGIGLVNALVLGLTFSLIRSLISGLIYGVFLGLFGMLVILLVSGLIGGLSSGILDEHNFVKPNQGIWRSARNGVQVGLIGGLVGWLVGVLVFGLLNGLAYGLVSEMVRGLAIGVMSGLLAGLLGGGDACIQHVVLRVLLWHSGCIPWNYPRFLDYATERILLRKVGGGYIFVHRLLLEYFATPNTEPTSSGEAESMQAAIPLASPPPASLVPPALEAPLHPPASAAPPALTTISEAPRLFPCGHEYRPNARYCSICGRPVPLG